MKDLACRAEDFTLFLVVRATEASEDEEVTGRFEVIQLWCGEELKGEMSS